MKQEVWITLRFKGEADASLALDKAAEGALRTMERHIKTNLGGMLHGITICQPGDVLDIEEEAQIYGND